MDQDTKATALKLSPNPDDYSRNHFRGATTSPTYPRAPAEGGAHPGRIITQTARSERADSHDGLGQSDTTATPAVVLIPAIHEDSMQHTTTARSKELATATRLPSLASPQLACQLRPRSRQNHECWPIFVATAKPAGPLPQSLDRGARHTITIRATRREHRAYGAPLLSGHGCRGDDGQPGLWNTTSADVKHHVTSKRTARHI